MTVSPFCGWYRLSFPKVEFAKSGRLQPGCCRWVLAATCCLQHWRLPSSVSNSQLLGGIPEVSQNSNKGMIKIQLLQPLFRHPVCCVCGTGAVPARRKVRRQGSRVSSCWGRMRWGLLRYSDFAFLCCYCTEFELRSLTQCKFVLALLGVHRLRVFLWKRRDSEERGDGVLEGPGRSPGAGGCYWPGEGAASLRNVPAPGVQQLPRTAMPLECCAGHKPFCGSDCETWAVVPTGGREKRAIKELPFKTQLGNISACQILRQNTLLSGTFLWSKTESGKWSWFHYNSVSQVSNEHQTEASSLPGKHESIISWAESEIAE